MQGSIVTSCLAAAFSCVFLLSLSAHADTLYARNGDIISGKIISFQDGICVFKIPYGAPINVPAQQIMGVATDDKYNVMFLSGEAVVGQLIRESDGTTWLASDNLGKVRVSTDAIRAMTRYFAPEPGQRTESQRSRSGKYGAEKSGQPPVDFLTGSTVLLAPGKIELDFGLQYKQTRTSYALPQAGYFQMASQNSRQLEMMTSLRAGMARNVEAWITVPFTRTHIRQVSSNDFVRSTSQWAFGDLSTGVQYQWQRETRTLPAMSLMMEVTAPTGRKRYYPAQESWKDPLSNGTGHWSVAPGIAFVRTTDPAMLLGALSYRHFFGRTIDGYRVRPGAGIAGYAGLGFALNEKLSLGTRVSYSHYGDMQADGQTMQGTDKDPLDLSLSASYRWAEQWVISPQVTFSLNSEAGPPFLSLRMSRRFE